ncbi:hypothetical protein BH09BAC1_BH09BAC1_24770 [soil metagenome]
MRAPFILILFLCCFGLSIFAQSSITYSYRTDSFSLYGLDAAKTADGGYLLLAYVEAAPDFIGMPIEGHPALGSLIIKLDSTGNEKWRYFHDDYYYDIGGRVSANQLVVLPNGNIVMPYRKYVGLYPTRVQPVIPGVEVPIGYCPTDKVAVLVLSPEGRFIKDTIYGQPFCTRYEIMGAQVVEDKIYLLCNDNGHLEWWQIDTGDYGIDSVSINLPSGSYRSFVIMPNKQVLMFTLNYSLKRFDVYQYDLDMNLLGSFSLDHPKDKFISSSRIHLDAFGRLYLYAHGTVYDPDINNDHDFFSIVYGFNADGEVFQYQVIQERLLQDVFGLPGNKWLTLGYWKTGDYYCLEERLVQLGNSQKTIGKLCEVDFAYLKYLSSTMYGVIGSINTGGMLVDGSTVGIYFKASPLPETNALENSFNFYPNPTVNLVSFPWQADMMGGYAQAYNINGQLVFEKELGLETTLDISSLLPGMYICRILNKERQLLQIGKLVKE